MGYSQKQAANIIASYGFTLVGKYINSASYIEIYCPTCDQNFSTIWSHFTKKNRGGGGKCLNCNKIKNRAKNIIPFDKIREDFELMGYILLAKPDEYISKDTMLRCICPCGKETNKRRREVLAGQHCVTCGAESRAKLQRITKNEAINITNDKGLNIIEHSLNMCDPIQLECQKCKYKFTSFLTSVKYRMS
jgi:hypothetical protein